MFLGNSKTLVRTSLGILVVAFLGASTFAVGLVFLSFVETSQPVTPVLFDHGLTALDPQAPTQWTNQWCGSCHSQEYEQWKQSRHFVAGINDNFRKQCLASAFGRKQWCVNCHVPINPGLNVLPSQEPERLDEAFASRQQWLTNGVDCLACHVRDGHVLVTHITPKAKTAHPVRLAPELGTAEFCAGCHQFGFIKLSDGSIGEQQQASFEEFLHYRVTGGGETRCHDCHMPDGDHVMPGGYSLPMLRNALDLELSVQWHEDLKLVQVSVGINVSGVGHQVPGGEHFYRVLTLHTTLADAQGTPIDAKPIAPERNFNDQRSTSLAQNPESHSTKLVKTWPQIETFRQRMGPFERGVDLLAKPTQNTRLQPGEERRFDYLVPVDLTRTNAPIKARAELWYHILAEEEAIEFEFTVDEVMRLVLSEETSFAPDKSQQQTP